MAPEPEGRFCFKFVGALLIPAASPPQVASVNPHRSHLGRSTRPHRMPAALWRRLGHRVAGMLRRSVTWRTAGRIHGPSLALVAARHGCTDRVAQLLGRDDSRTVWTPWQSDRLVSLAAAAAKEAAAAKVEATRKARRAALNAATLRALRFGSRLWLPRDAFRPRPDVRATAVTPDGARALTVHGPMIFVWDLSRSVLERVIQAAVRESFTPQLHVTHSGHVCAYPVRVEQRYRPVVGVWEIDTGKFCGHLPNAGHDREMRFVRYDDELVHEENHGVFASHPTRPIVASWVTGPDGDSIFIHDISSGRTVARVRHDGYAVDALHYIPSGRLVAVVARDRSRGVEVRQADTDPRDHQVRWLSEWPLFFCLQHTYECQVADGSVFLYSDKAMGRYELARGFSQPDEPSARAESHAGHATPTPPRPQPSAPSRSSRAVALPTGDVLVVRDKQGPNTGVRVVRWKASLYGVPAAVEVHLLDGIRDPGVGNPSLLDAKFSPNRRRLAAVTGHWGLMVWDVHPDAGSLQLLLWRHGEKEASVDPRREISGASVHWVSDTCIVDSHGCTTSVWNIDEAALGGSPGMIGRPGSASAALSRLQAVWCRPPLQASPAVVGARLQARRRAGRRVAAMLRRPLDWRSCRSVYGVQAVAIAAAAGNMEQARAGFHTVLDPWLRWLLRRCMVHLLPLPSLLRFHFGDAEAVRCQRIARRSLVRVGTTGPRLLVDHVVRAPRIIRNFGKWEEQPLGCVTVSHDGRTLVARCSFNSVLTWDLVRGRLERVVPVADCGKCAYVRVSGDGAVAVVAPEHVAKAGPRAVAVATGESMWEVPVPTNVLELGRGGVPRSMRPSAHLVADSAGRRMCTWVKGGGLKLFCAQTGRVLFDDENERFHGKVVLAAFHSTGALCVFTEARMGWESRLTLLTLRDDEDQRVHMASWTLDSVAGLAWHPDPDVVAVCGGVRSPVSLYRISRHSSDSTTLEPTHRLTAAGGACQAEFDQAARHMVALLGQPSSRDGFAVVVDVATNSVLARVVTAPRGMSRLPLGRPWSTRAVAFSHDGSLLAAVDGCGELAVWSMPAFTLVCSSVDLPGRGETSVLTMSSSTESCEVAIMWLPTSTATPPKLLLSYNTRAVVFTVQLGNKQQAPATTTRELVVPKRLPRAVRHAVGTRVAEMLRTPVNWLTARRVHGPRIACIAATCENLRQVELCGEGTLLWSGKAGEEGLAALRKAATRNKPHVGGYTNPFAAASSASSSALAAAATASLPSLEAGWFANALQAVPAVAPAAEAAASPAPPNPFLDAFAAAAAPAAAEPASAAPPNPFLDAFEASLTSE